jgi:hypothetical protein
MSDKEHAKSKREEQKAFKVHEYAMLKCRIEAENSAQRCSARILVYCILGEMMCVNCRGENAKRRAKKNSDTPPASTSEQTQTTALLLLLLHQCFVSWWRSGR